MASWLSSVLVLFISPALQQTVGLNDTPGGGLNGTTGDALPSIPGKKYSLPTSIRYPPLFLDHAEYILTKPSDVGHSGKGHFPFVVFLHALTMKGSAMINGYSDLITNVAKKGFIVLTCLSFPVVTPANTPGWVKDHINGAKHHIKLTDADFEKVGVFGHSMGGGATVHAIASIPSDYHIKVGVAIHPWQREDKDPIPSEVKVPMMYLTGTKDTNVKDSLVKHMYEETKTSKVYANGKGFNHMAPLNKPLGNGIWPPYVAAFLSCYLHSSQPDCGKVHYSLAKDKRMAAVYTDVRRRRRTKRGSPRTQETASVVDELITKKASDTELIV
jgi:hypothetical protein